MPYWTPGSERHDIAAIRWLFEEEQLQISSESPVQAALAALAPTDSPRLDLSQHITVKMAQILGWSIRALWGEGARGGAKVDKSFVEQLLRPDLEGNFSLPSGVGVLWTAARWHREGGGEIRICGNGAKGLDIVWTPDLPGHPSVHAECKDRAVSRSLVEGEQEFRRYLRDKLPAASAIPRPQHGIRVLVVGFLTSVAVGKALRDQFRDFVLEERPLSLERRADWPDAVAGNFLSFDYDETIPFGDCRALGAFGLFRRWDAPNPALAEIEPLFRSIYGERGRDPVLPFSSRSDERLSIREDIQPYLGMTPEECAVATSKLSRWARDVAEEAPEPGRVWGWRDLPPDGSTELWKKLVSRFRASRA